MLGRYCQDRRHNEQMGFPSGTVTLLLADVEGSVRVWEADREAMAEAPARYGRMVCELVEAAGGGVFKSVGEAFGAVFTDPSAALWCAVQFSGLPVLSGGRPGRRSL